MATHAPLTVPADNALALRHLSSAQLQLLLTAEGLPADGDREVLTQRLQTHLLPNLASELVSRPLKGCVTKHVGAAYVSIDGIIHRVGGYPATPDAHQRSQDACTMEVYRFDWGLCAWEQVCSACSSPPARAGHSCIGFDGKLWVYGGVKLGESNSMDELWCYDLRARKWSQVQQLAYNQGAQHQTDHLAALYSKYMLIYPSSSQVRQASPLPASRGEHTVRRLDTILYAFDLHLRHWHSLKTGGVASDPTQVQAIATHGTKLYALVGSPAPQPPSGPKSTPLPCDAHRPAVMPSSRVFALDLTSLQWAAIKTHGAAPEGVLSHAAGVVAGNTWLVHAMPATSSSPATASSAMQSACTISTSQLADAGEAAGGCRHANGFVRGSDDAAAATDKPMAVTSCCWDAHADSTCNAAEGVCSGAGNDGAERMSKGCDVDVNGNPACLVYPRSVANATERCGCPSTNSTACQLGTQIADDASPVTAHAAAVESRQEEGVPLASRLPSSLYELDFGSATWQLLGSTTSSSTTCCNRPTLLHADGLLVLLGSLQHGSLAHPLAEQLVMQPSDRHIEQRVHNVDSGANLGKFFGQAALSDVELAAGGVRFPAHRVILALSSPVFARMFANDMLESHTRLVQVREIQPRTLRALLAYCYGEFPAIGPDMAAHLLVAAERYAVSGLADQCTTVLIKGLHAGNAAALRQLALTHNSPRLLEACANYL